MLKESQAKVHKSYKNIFYFSKIMQLLLLAAGGEPFLNE